MIRIFAYFALLTVLAGIIRFSTFRTEATEETHELNVILLTIDALRADHLGCYGYKRNTSPNIDKFASNGVLFENTVAQIPKTGPSVSSIMTSQYMQSAGVYRNGEKLSRKKKTIAERLFDLSYFTAAFLTNANLIYGSGHEQGFVLFNNYHTAPAEKVLEGAVDWLEGNRLKKFFLWIHLLDPHGPYTPPAKYRSMFVDDPFYDGAKTTPSKHYKTYSGNNSNDILGSIPEYQLINGIDKVDYYIAQYDAEIFYMDEALRSLFETIENLGLQKNSIIIIGADHGESMGEHDYYFEHGMFVYQGNVNVPLIIKYPGGPQGKRVPQIVQNIDITPTLLDFLGVNIKEEWWKKFFSRQDRMEGKSLLPLIKGETREENFAVSEIPHEYDDHRSVMVQKGRWKFIMNSDKGDELYNLAEDHDEKNNQAEKHPELVKELRGHIRDIPKAAKKKGPEDNIKFGKKEKEELKALGYLQ